ncbi:Membrane protein involved in the export of O-antigen and teichoic acid [Clostridium amylolyticum]|uniref:Membrane protein involved in the export of O-antigen and teichoic acid n=1 Tax=Clostridium amylolyticum TaxID=1121298 RepID=A0A1M6M6I5_9CLOT|nr:oligosaccharide flippase family protein [Clostridium amylolyticum]SHJ79072.1 Membrane protein involved in the export of O-antigen and teichoic acid [Clostridium amylolyticum]
MENKAIQFIKNFFYTISSNLISLIISTLVVIVVPKLVGVEEYGYWQLYLFYSSYVGFLHFGWSDGIYLRYGGEEYSDLDKKTFSSQFYMMMIFQFFIAVIIVIVAILFVNNNDRVFIFIMVALNALIVNVLSVLLLTLQATNRIKNYAQINIISRVSYIILILMFLFIGVREYRVMIVADLMGKTLSLIYAIYACKDIVINKLNTLNLSFTETIENIRVGIKLMFANIASMLIIGVVRFGIEYSWDVSTFGKISLTLSVSNLLMLFINATGIVIFPVLRKLSVEALPQLYLVVRDILMVILFGILVLYFPMNALLTRWLPNYADSLAFMALLFPISLYEGKMGLLINTYLKTLRKERFIMRVNMIVLLLSGISTIFTTVIFRNLNAAVLSILIAISIRSILAEKYLAEVLKINVIKDIIYETTLTVLFVLIGWNINSIAGFALYLFAVISYVFLKRKGLKDSFNKMKMYMES